MGDTVDGDVVVGGSNVRTRQVTMVLNDGSQVTANMQVISIADDQGRMIDLDVAGTLGAILNELQKLSTFMEIHLG